MIDAYRWTHTKQEDDCLMVSNGGIVRELLADEPDRWVLAVDYVTLAKDRDDWKPGPLPQSRRHEMSDKEALLAAYQWKLRLIRQTCKDALDDCAGWDLKESGPAALETLEYIRDHLAKEPTE